MAAVDVRQPNVGPPRPIDQRAHRMASPDTRSTRVSSTAGQVKDSPSPVIKRAERANVEYAHAQCGSLRWHGPATCRMTT